MSNMDLFRSDNKEITKPIQYPNLALRGNRVVKYKLNKTSSYDRGGRELQVPSLPYLDGIEERKAINLTMLANKYFRFDRYKKLILGTEDIIYLSQLISSVWHVKLMYKKLCYPSRIDASTKNLVGNNWWGNVSEELLEYDKGILQSIVKFFASLPEYSPSEAEDKYYVENISDYELKNIKHEEGMTKEMFNYITYKKLEKLPYPLINESYIQKAYAEMVTDYYDTRDYRVAHLNAVRKLALVDNDVDWSKIRDEILNQVKSNQIIGTFDNELIEEEVTFFENMCRHTAMVIRNAQQLPSDMRKFPYKALKYSWQHRERTGYGYMTTYPKKYKGMVRKVYNKLTLNDWDGKYYDEKFSNKITPMEMAQKAKEAVQDGIKLPESLDKETKDEIKKQANHDATFLYRNAYSSTGVHGNADIKPFKPKEKVNQAIRELRKRNSDYGVVPKNMHRMALDRKVFSSRRTVAGGSMMIDFSGSMGWYTEEVVEIIKLLPASTIAGYVGYGSYRNDTSFSGETYHGMIEIIADKGRYDSKAIDRLKEYGQNNIDFDAVKWLAKQPLPRILVSDLQFIGVNEVSGNTKELSAEKRLEIMNFMVKNNIIPINNYNLVHKVAKQLATSVKQSK